MKKDFYVLENDITNGGEYRINDGIKRMMDDGKVFVTGTGTRMDGLWEQRGDCRNQPKDVGAFFIEDETGIIRSDVLLENNEIIPPCFIGKGVKLKNAKIGPHVSLGAGTIVENGGDS